MPAGKKGRPIYVLAGIPLPAPMYWKTQYQPDTAETKFWNSVIQETAAQLGTHPAILGFIIQNEQEGADVTYKIPELAQFWWGQVQAIAAVVKAAAPTKLVGMATHDDPNIPGQAVSYTACALLGVEAQDAAFQRHRHRLRAILHIELGKDVQEVSLDRCFTDEERAADLLVGLTPGHVFEDLDLARAERLVSGRPQTVHQARHDRRREDRGPGGRRADGAKELFAGGVFEQVPVAPASIAFRMSASVS
jgi:hypothetical protein